MLEQFTLDTFTPHVGTSFRVHVEGAAPIQFVLEWATEVPVSGWRPGEAAEHRTPFSLQFLGPPGFILQQAIYTFEHEKIGTFEIFIVPISQDAKGVSYEVVFS
jgi:hypothetical protein